MRRRRKKKTQNQTVISVPVQMKSWQPSSGCTAVGMKKNPVTRLFDFKTTACPQKMNRVKISH